MERAYGTTRAYKRLSGIDQLGEAYPQSVGDGLDVVDLGDGWTQTGSNSFQYVSSLAESPAISLSSIQAAQSYTIYFNVRDLTGSAPKIDIYVGSDSVVSHTISVNGVVEFTATSDVDNDEIRFVVSTNATNATAIIEKLTIRRGASITATSPLEAMADVWLRPQNIQGITGNSLDKWNNKAGGDDLYTATDIDTIQIVQDLNTGNRVCHSLNGSLRPASPLPSTPQPFVVFLAFNADNISSLQALFDSYAQTKVTISATSTGEIRLNSGAGTSLTSKVVSINTNTVLAIKVDGANSAIWFNTDIKHNFTAGSNNLVPYRLFRKGASGVYQAFQGWIGEFALVTLPMTDNQIETAINIMADEWL